MPMDLRISPQLAFQLQRAIQRWENEGGEVLEIASLSNTKAFEEGSYAEDDEYVGELAVI